MSDLFFFGAGASSPFRIPTMQEMVTEFEKTLQDGEPDLFNYYSKIKKALIDAFGSSNIDIEAMLSVLEGISKNVEPKDFGHFAFYYISQIGLKKPFASSSIESAKKILEKLKEYIKNSCTVKLSSTQLTEVYERSYVPLFSNVGGAKKSRFHGRYDLFTGWKSYTTNYDDIFENFWNRFKVPQDHFDRLGDSENYAFNSTRLVLDNHSFAKLHGSLNWTYNKENQTVIKVVGGSFIPFQTGGDVMLFPIQQKDLYLYPWYALFQDFKSGLMKCEKWYVIGYAFNDEFIRNVFIEQLRLRNKPTLVIINPNVDSIIDKFPRELREKIILLPIRFGIKNFPLEFSDYMKGQKTFQIEIQTKSEFIGIESSKKIISLDIFEKDQIEVRGTESFDGEYMANALHYVNPKNNPITMELKIEYDITSPEDIVLQFISGSSEKFRARVLYGDLQVGSQVAMPVSKVIRRMMNLQAGPELKISRHSFIKR